MPTICKPNGEIETLVERYAREAEIDARIAAKQLSTYDCCAIVEGFDGEEHDEEEILAAWQHLIDTGLAFQLQGWYGRTASSLIQSGQCNPPR